MKTLRFAAIPALAVLLCACPHPNGHRLLGGGSGDGGDDGGVTPKTVDTTPPGPITKLAADISDKGTVTFTWTDPADDDLWHVEIWYAWSPYDKSGVDIDPPVMKGKQTCTVKNNLGYPLYFYFTAVDEAGNRSVPVKITGTPMDKTPPRKGYEPGCRPRRRICHPQLDRPPRCGFVSYPNRVYRREREQYWRNG